MGECPQQYKLDVNDRYQAAVSAVVTLSTASLVLPIFFLKDINGFESGKPIMDSISKLVIWGWVLLGLSILSAIVYQYVSAKWVKMAWGQQADIFGMNISDRFAESALDITYFLMMVGFLGGLLCMIIFMVTFKPH